MNNRVPMLFTLTFIALFALKVLWGFGISWAIVLCPIYLPVLFLIAYTILKTIYEIIEESRR